ncbi:MAG TPA: hypothetical protein VHW01_06405 [Polyangiaceae bacterium]|jgi:hypothetical protein|nr:hypothetical protein [Polyangiaceae bacterium]
MLEPPPALAPAPLDEDPALLEEDPALPVAPDMPMLPMPVVRDEALLPSLPHAFAQAQMHKKPNQPRLESVATMTTNLSARQSSMASFEETAHWPT